MVQRWTTLMLITSQNDAQYRPTIKIKVKITLGVLFWSNVISYIMVIKMTNCWNSLCLQNLFRGIIKKINYTVVTIHWTVQGVIS